MEAAVAVAGSPAVAVEANRALLDKIVEKQAEAASQFMPVMSVAQAKLRSVAIAELKELVLEEGIDKDYGTIPGTSKPTLFKPGAEKICAYFGYVPKYIFLEKIEDWDGDSHRGEPLFYYQIECVLHKGTVAVGSALGSCNTREKKYRYRNGERTCPHCGKAAIHKSKDAGGGFFCWTKKGGCGAKFADKDSSIVGQDTGQVLNPDIFDCVNPVLKIACKRAYVSATLSATGASQYFVPDLEDMQDVSEGDLRRQAAKVDTGGAPVGTSQAADNVAQRKIAEGRKKEEAPPKQQGQSQLAPDDPFVRCDWKGIMTFFGKEKQRVGEDAYYAAMRPLMPPDCPPEKLHANHIRELDKMRAFRDALAAIRVVPFVPEPVPVSVDSTTQEATA